MSSRELLDKLAHFRLHTVHRPREVADAGETLLKKGALKSSSDEIWSTLEQIAVAAAECGRYDLAETCANRLSARFPGSPRADVLLGELLEGRGLVDDAKKLYETILRNNEADVPIRKRLISLHLHAAPLSTTSSDSVSKTRATASEIGAVTGLSRDKGLLMLVEYLDTYYDDVQGWAEAASVYASMRLYPQSLAALSHLILLAPHNPFHLVRHAETAYTMGDYPLAYKEFLRVIEISDGVSTRGGVGRRAALGVKLCVARLGGKLSDSVADPLLVPSRVQDVELMVTKLILDAYGGAGATGAPVVRKWVGGSVA